MLLKNDEFAQKSAINIYYLKNHELSQRNVIRD